VCPALHGLRREVSGNVDRGPFRGPFLPATSAIPELKSGADARFQEANRQVAVVSSPSTRMGFRGSRVQIPPSRSR
jgi:hypothetical protein